MVASAGSLILKMVIAAFSGMGGATFCHPFDVIRVQMQTEGSEYKNMLDAASQIRKKEGVAGLYAGISAAYLRQWLYGSCRIGIYAFLLEQAQHENIEKGLDKNLIPFTKKLVMGMISGGIGSFVGTPSEVSLVRMSNDSKLPVNQRRNYKNVVDALGRIASEEGVLKLWTGAKVTVLRAMVLSACQLAFASQIKLKLTLTGLFGEDGQLGGGVPLMFVSALCASFIATFASNPMDVIKSRTQNQKVGKDGSRDYDGMLDCFFKIMSNEGFFMLWAGFWPAFIKLAPKGMIELTLNEKITKAITGKDAL